ncbi:hypothetical protein E2320_000226 [Naja naja]|nr:hypothetical protein E2320_000226 [Naja naja]
MRIGQIAEKGSRENKQADCRERENKSLSNQIAEKGNCRERDYKRVSGQFAEKGTTEVSSIAEKGPTRSKQADCSEWDYKRISREIAEKGTTRGEADRFQRKG